jgi:hypothetical protein
MALSLHPTEDKDIPLRSIAMTNTIQPVAHAQMYLEYGIDLKLIEDHDPAALAKGWVSRHAA